MKLENRSSPEEMTDKAQPGMSCGRRIEVRKLSRSAVTGASMRRRPSVAAVFPHDRHPEHRHFSP
jgi:hypothetical protein